jgi:hypothetical protein
MHRFQIRCSDGYSFDCTDISEPTLSRAIIAACLIQECHPDWFVGISDEHRDCSGEWFGGLNETVREYVEQMLAGAKRAGFKARAA